VDLTKCYICGKNCSRLTEHLRIKHRAYRSLQNEEFKRIVARQRQAWGLELNTPEKRLLGLMPPKQPRRRRHEDATI
jgi:hypothetical protein